MVDEAVEAELRKLEQSLWISGTRFDLDYMEKVLAPDFMDFGRSGRTYTRRETLAVPAAEIVANLPLKDFKVHSIAGDVFLVTYVSDVTYEQVQIANRSSVWSKATGRWQIHFHQGTPAAR
jgi:hypothetical protein